MPDKVSQLAAVTTTLIKLSPYDEEEPAIWFRLIKAHFAAAAIRPQKLKYANTLANLPKQDISLTLWRACNLT